MVCQLVVVATMLLAGCAKESDHAAIAITITIATDATFPPFHYVAGDGNVTGFDVELARELARRAGFDHDVVVVPYEKLFDDLLAHRYQVVAATTGITPVREERYLFSNAYFDTCQAALVRVGDDEPLSLGDLAGRRVGAAGSGTSVQALERLPDSIPVLLSQREATEDTIRDDGTVPVLETGFVDALLVDEMDAVEAARASNGKLRVLAEPVALERYGFVFAPDNIELGRAFDAALAAMQEDGTLQELRSEFGLDRGDDWPIEFDN